MLYLHTLGDALITVGEKEIRPTAPLVFAALLYLGMERGHRVPRAALQELLFPKSDERSGAHSLRQLLYKLRQLGAPIEADGTAVVVDDVSIDVSEWKSEDVHADPEFVRRISLGLLPGYQPAISPGFERWLDVRSETAAQIRSVLLDELARSRQSGDQLAVQQIATALLKLDPLNEEATLSHAEALALSGQSMTQCECSRSTPRTWAMASRSLAWRPTSAVHPVLGVRPGRRRNSADAGVRVRQTARTLLLVAVFQFAQ